MQHRRFFIFSCFLFPGIVLFTNACRTETPFAIEGQHPDDLVTWSSSEGPVTLLIECPSGIGKLTLTNRAEWPDTLMVQLSLKGLESFAIESGPVRYRIEATRDGGVISEPPEGNPLVLVAQPAGTGFGVYLVRVDLRSVRGEDTDLILSWIDFYR